MAAKKTAPSKAPARSLPLWSPPSGGRSYGPSKTASPQAKTTVVKAAKPAAKKTAAPKAAPAGGGRPPARSSSSAQQRGAATGARSKGSARDKATAAASAAQPELAPLLQGVNNAHHKVFDGKGRLTSGAPSRVLLIEFLVCFVILGLGTIVAPTGSKDGVPRMMSRGTGLCLLFFILGLGAAAGPGARRAANGLGGLVTVSYVVTSTDAHNVFAWITGYFSKDGVSSATAGGAAGGLAGSGAAETAAGQGAGDLGTAAAGSSGGSGAALGGAAGAVAGAAE